MKVFVCFFLIFLLLFCFSCGAPSNQPIEMTTICDQYLKTWKQFYPSRALSAGMLSSIFSYEDFSGTRIEDWLKYNNKLLNQIEKHKSEFNLNDKINARLLITQIKIEIEKWGNKTPHKNSLSFYSDCISNAVPPVLNSKLLVPSEKYHTLLKRLEAVKYLCSSAIQQLENKTSENIEKSIKNLEETKQFYKRKLPELAKEWINPKDLEIFTTKCSQTSSEIQKLILYVEENISTNQNTSNSNILGRQEYDRRLKLYTDSDLTTEKLEEMALEEIHTVRQLMADASTDYLKEKYPNQQIPEELNALVKKALKDMENNYPKGEQDYLQLWNRLAQKAENFIREKNITTLPENQTLSIVLAPESAGPNARIGWVQPAPPFHPNPWTTIYLPTIPDSFPGKERKDFWQSFNNYFTRFIVIHELFPGHYIQNKIKRENPHQVRILFPYGLYSEGWATLCEKIVLDAGWDDNNKLTRLAQLRKRLENANRAYTSVQVHCNGWDQEKMMEFSTNTSLLAPQFAKSLWGRLLASPMQITSYFLGTKQFLELYEDEKKRLGENFNSLTFMDTILRAGPIPIDEFKHIFMSE
jgi:hypothetical protein